MIVIASAHYIPFSYHTVVHHPIEEKHEKKVETWTEKAKSEYEHKEPEKPAHYDFKYEVHDEKTGDIKRLSEVATHGVVKGQYSLIDSDGFKRIVEYTADNIHGFQAIVKREPTHHKIPQPQPKYEEYKPDNHWW